MHKVLRRWLNTILHLSSHIYSKKTETFSSGALKTIWLIIQIVGLELILLFISFPLYFFVTPDKSFFNNKKQIKAYHLRRNLTFVALSGLFVYYCIHLLIGLFGLFGLPQSCEAAISSTMTVSGSYVGNGSDDRAITGLCFQPDVVMIKSATTDYQVIRTSTMEGDVSKQLDNPSSGLEANLIQSLDSDGFTIGSDNRVNRTSTTYYWVAFKNNPGDMKVGTFYGNGSSNHAISGVGFQPDFVIFVPTNNTSATMRSSAMTNGKSYYFWDADSGFTGGLTSFDADGFTVSAYAMNATSVQYHYIAWKKADGKMNVGSYTGNGSDNRNIIGVGFQPEYMFIRGNSYYNAYQSFSSLSGDNSVPFKNLSASSNKIQQLQEDGFQIGNDGSVNSSSTLYFWVAFAKSVPPVFTQSTYRFFNNEDSINPGTPLAANNTGAVLATSGGAFRLRMLMNVSNAQLTPSAETFKLQYAEKGTGSCDVPGGTNPASYTDVTNSTLIAYKDNASVNDGAFITHDSNDPVTDPPNGYIYPQSYVESNNFTNGQSDVFEDTYGEWDFSLYDNGALESATYCFRIVPSDNSEVLNAYSVYPEITTAPADHIAPTVTNVTASADGLYSINSSISIRIIFDEAVYVVGVPQLMLETGTVDAIANYTSGNGTNTLTFTYTVGAGENSANLDYIDVTSLILNDATIRDGSNNDAILTLPIPGQNGSLSANNDIVIDTQAPTVLDVGSLHADGTYRIDDTLNIQITLNETVTVTGNPTLALETGDSDAIASYTSGDGTNTLIFTYTIGAGENTNDLDYVDTNALSLGGGTIKDKAGNDLILGLPTPGDTGSLGSNKNIVINTDVTSPTILNVTSTKADGLYGPDEAIPVIIEWDEDVIVTGTPYISLATGDVPAMALYSSGSGTHYLTFIYTVSTGDTSTDLDYTDTSALSLSGGTIQDSSGNDAILILPAPSSGNSLSGNKDIVIDTTPPDTDPPITINVTSSTADGAYKEGDNIAIQLNMSENVIVSGVPRLLLDVGGTESYALYNSGSGTSELIFYYTILTGENSSHLDYIGRDSLDLNGGSIQDIAGNSLENVLPSPGQEGSLSANKNIVVDTTLPTIINVTSPNSDETYGVGDNILLRVQWSEPVTVIGTPQLNLETGNSDAVADYISGSGSDTLTFTYTVAEGDNSADLDYIGPEALNPNSGTIADTAGNNAILYLPSPADIGSLSANKDIIIDTLGPTITNVTATVNDGTYKIGDNITVQIEFNESVVVNGAPHLELTTGENSRIIDYSSGSGTSTLNFDYVVADGESINKLTYLDANALHLNDGTIEDTVGNQAIVTLPSPGDVGSLIANKSIVIDGVAPSPATLIVSKTGSNSMLIRWTATGNDGTAGTSTRYYLHYSSTPITDDNFDIATEIDHGLTPGASGIEEQIEIYDLLPSTRYYFALKISDAAGNLSRLSNVPSLTTLAAESSSPQSPAQSTSNRSRGGGGGGGSSSVKESRTNNNSAQTNLNSENTPSSQEENTSSSANSTDSANSPTSDNTSVPSLSSEHPFSDMTTHWAKLFVQKLQDQCAVTGYNQDKLKNPLFKPDNAITRAELVTLIMKCKYGILSNQILSERFLTDSVLPDTDKQIFEDVPVDHWAAPYIKRAVVEGIITATNKNFRPDDPVILAEALKIILLARFDQENVQTSVSATECLDVAPADWFAPYFGYAVKTGIVERYLMTNGLCQPASLITRAETAKILMIDN